MKRLAVIAGLLAVFASCKKSGDNTITPSSTTVSPGVVPGVFKNLHNFNDTAGADPLGALTMYNGVLYGMASQGGANSQGCIFSINTNGTGYRDLHDFAGEPDGGFPTGSLTLSGNMLYGMTTGGGTINEGIIFSINPDGSGYNILYNFGFSTTGANPNGSLTISGNVMYGVTVPASGTGNLFSISTSGKNYTDLHDFSLLSQGFQPISGVVLSGNVLYGMTGYGGNSFGDGVIYSINTDGSNFQDIYVFNGSVSGANPDGSLLVSDGKLYGMTADGGANSYGTIFSVNTDGSSFNVLYNFNNTYSNNSLVLSGSTLYGATYGGNVNRDGTIFSISTGGGGFTNLFYFNNTNGAFPQGALLLSGSMLYGMTDVGGTDSDGIIFSYSL